MEIEQEIVHDLANSDIADDLKWPRPPQITRRLFLRFVSLFISLEWLKVQFLEFSK